MYVETGNGKWHYMPPDGCNAESGLSMYVGKAAFYLACGERFYGASPLYVRRPWDSVILHAIEHRQSVMETNALLESLGETQLLK